MNGSVVYVKLDVIDEGESHWTCVVKHNMHELLNTECFLQVTRPLLNTPFMTLVIISICLIYSFSGAGCSTISAFASVCRNCVLVWFGFSCAWNVMYPLINDRGNKEEEKQQHQQPCAPLTACLTYLSSYSTVMRNSCVLHFSSLYIYIYI